MREQLEALEELAKIDLGYRQLDVELDELNARLASLREDVARIRELLEREKVQLAEGETLRVQTVGEVEDLAERMARSTKRQQAAKSNREVDATTREVEVLRREREERAGKVGELESAVGQVRESIARHEADFAKLQDLLAAEEGAVVARSREIEAKRKIHDELRKGVATRVRPDLLRKYNTIRERKTTAVADVVGGICRGCHISLPPQLFNQIHAGKQIYQCPNCHRILVHRAVNAGA